MSKVGNLLPVGPLTSPLFARLVSRLEAHEAVCFSKEIRPRRPSTPRGKVLELPRVGVTQAEVAIGSSRSSCRAIPLTEAGGTQSTGARTTRSLPAAPNARAPRRRCALRDRNFPCSIRQHTLSGLSRGHGERGIPGSTLTPRISFHVGIIVGWSLKTAKAKVMRGNDDHNGKARLRQHGRINLERAPSTASDEPETSRRGDRRWEPRETSQEG